MSRSHQHQCAVSERRRGRGKKRQGWKGLKFSEHSLRVECLAVTNTSVPEGRVRGEEREEGGKEGRERETHSGWEGWSKWKEKEVISLLITHTHTHTLLEQCSHEDRVSRHLSGTMVPP